MMCITFSGTCKEQSGERGVAIVHRGMTPSGYGKGSMAHTKDSMALDFTRNREMARRNIVCALCLVKTRILPDPHIHFQINLKPNKIPPELIVRYSVSHIIQLSIKKNIYMYCLLQLEISKYSLK